MKLVRWNMYGPILWLSTWQFWKHCIWNSKPNYFILFTNPFTSIWKIKLGANAWDNTSHNHPFRILLLGNIPWNIFTKVLKNISNFWINKNTIMLNFMYKISRNMSFSKVLKPIYKSFLCLKTNIIMFNECFWKKIIHWIFFKLIHMFQWYIKNLTIN